MNKCTMCGNDFDIWDEQLGFIFEDTIGYGSKHDGDLLKLKLCCGCLDKTIELISPNCFSSPVIRGEHDEHDE